MKEFEVDTNGKISHVQEFLKISNNKICTLQYAVIHWFHIISIKIFKGIFTETDKIILKFVWNHIRSWVAKVFLRKNNRARNLTPPDFKLCHKAIVVKIGIKKRHISNGKTWEPRMICFIYHQLIFEKDIRKTQWENMLTSYQRCLENWSTTEPLFILLIVINSKWIKDVTRTPEAIKLLEGTWGKVSWHWSWQWFFWIWHQMYKQK